MNSFVTSAKSSRKSLNVDVNAGLRSMDTKSNEMTLSLLFPYPTSAIINVILLRQIAEEIRKNRLV